MLHLVSRLDGARIASGDRPVERAGGIGRAALIAYDGEATSTYELSRHKITPITEALTSRNPISGYNVTRRLAQVIRDQKVDMVHAQNATLAAVGEGCAQGRCEMITTFCDGPSEVATLSKKTRTALLNLDHVLTLSHHRQSVVRGAARSCANG